MATKILYIILFISSICFGQISRNPQFVQFLQYDTSYTATGQEPIGTRYWDEAEGTTSLVLDNGVILQDGQEVYYPVINQTGGELENGKVAHYDGINGNSGTLKVDYSVASKTSVIPYFLGVITETIPNGGTGKVTRFGKVRGIQTNGADYGETWEDGDVLYVSTVNAGGMTNVMPSAPNPAIKIGWVISAHGTNGTIFVNPSYPDRLEDLADVDGKPLVNTGQVPVWNNASEYFDFTHRIETTLAKTDTSLTTGKGIANYTQAVKDSIYTKVNPTFTAGDSSTTMRIGDASQSFGATLRLSGGTSTGSAIAFRNYLNIVDSSDATGRVALFGGTDDSAGGGLWAFGKDHNIRGDTTKRGIVEIFTNSQNGTTSLGGALRWVMYDGTGYKLRYSGTKDGAHTWYDETGAKLGAWETDNYFNSVLGYEVNGTNINTTGTLSNVAYKGQDNAFTTDQSIAGKVYLTGASKGIFSGTGGAEGESTGAVIISASNSGGGTITRGADIGVYGNNHTSEAGNIILRTGNATGSSMKVISKGNANNNFTIDETGNVSIKNATITEAFNVTGNIKASGTIKGTTFDATTALQLNGTSINTTGTLSNVAYKGQNNNFTASQSIAGNLILANNGTIQRDITGNTSDGADSSAIRITPAGGLAVGRGGYIILGGEQNTLYPSEVRLQAGTGGKIQLNGSTTISGILTTRTLYAESDNTYYIGKNDDDSPLAYKGIILKDQAGTGKYYRIEVYDNALRIVDLTD